MSPWIACRSDATSQSALLPVIADHLDHCLDCRDQYETLTAFWKKNQQSRWYRLRGIAGLGQSLLRRRHEP